MPQSLSRMHVHLVFSTKDRSPWIHDRVRDALHRYMAAILYNVGSVPLIINSVEDHIHILFHLGRTIALCDAVKEVKKSSSKWLKTQGPELASFQWQCGYGAFAVSESIVPVVHRYIAQQKEHHRQKAFQEEYREHLIQNNIPFDEKYIWD